MECSQCNDQRDEDQLVRFGGEWLCQACKEIHVQQLKEGAGDRESYCKTALLAWERFRLLFNFILLLEGLTLSWVLDLASEQVFLEPRYWFAVLLLGFVINCMFSLGPLTDMYLYLIFKRKLENRRYFFAVGGLILSMLFLLYLGIAPVI